MPTVFPEANKVFRPPPPDLNENQCNNMHAHVGIVERGSVDGSVFVVTAWKPSPLDLEKLNKGAMVYLTCLGGLPPHFLSTDFQTASHPA